MKRMQLDNFDAYYVDIALNKGGLCNQLYPLVHAIAVCIKRKKNRLFVGNFRLEAYMKNKCKASIVFDFEKMNTYFKNKYNLYLEDQNSIKFFKGRIFPIKETIGNHIPNVVSPLGIDIIQNIYFRNEIIWPANRCLNAIIKDDDKAKINLIHMRTEEDAIKHWSQMNGMSNREFEKVLSNSYINLIKKHINKDTPTIIVSGTKNNSVLNFLQLNGYRYFLCKKTSPYREVNAIFDLHLAKSCNNIFIGAGGSTFTQTIILHFNNELNSKIINLNDIREKL